MSVWRVILEETDVLAKKRLLAAETYLEKVAEPSKPLKTTKQQSVKKVKLECYSCIIQGTKLAAVAWRRGYHIFTHIA